MVERRQGMNRRRFVQAMATAGAAYAVDGITRGGETRSLGTGKGGESNAATASRPFPAGLASRQWVEFRAAGFSEPVCGVVYRSDAPMRPVCGVPLGGIGTGCLDIETDGRLGFCTIFRRVWGHDRRDWVWALGEEDLEVLRKAGVSAETVVDRAAAHGLPPGIEQYLADGYVLRKGVTRDLSSEGRGPLNLPFLGMSVGRRTWVLSSFPLRGLEGANRIHYWGHYPVADLEYETDAPVSVGVRAWAPFLPGDLEYSQLPGAVFEVTVRNPGSLQQRGALAFSFPGPNEDAAGGHRFQRERAQGAFSGVVVRAPKASYALGVIGQEELRLGGGLGADGAAWARLAQTLPAASESQAGASAAVDFILAPGQQKTIRFVLAWHTPEWESEFPYGLKLHRYTNMYTEHYPSALSAAQRLAANHESLLRRVLAWQQVVYAEKDFPLWLRDQLVNVLHLIPEMSFWAAGKPPLGDWCYQGGLFSLVESTVADGQQTCIPCDWYGNFPIVYFFPDLAWSTLRALRLKMRADGAVPFILGRGLDMAGGPSEGDYDHDRQESQNGVCYADMVGRLWLVTGNEEVLREFYPSVKQNAIYAMNRHPAPDNVLGFITPGNEWYEGFGMRGITAHAGGSRLAQLRLVERMAEKMGDSAFAEQCRQWFAQGSRRLEEKLWDGEGYLLSLDTRTGEKNDLVLAFQLDGDWITGLHGLPGVFPQERALRTLATIKRLNVEAAGPRGVTLTVIQRDGRLTTFGDRMGWSNSAPASVFILGMNYIYAGQREIGLDIAYRSLHQLVNVLGFTWDMPNMVRADPAPGALPENLRIYGNDYYQCMSLWAFPAALRGQDLRGPAAPGGLVARILEAAGKA